MDRYLEETELLDYSCLDILKLIDSRGFDKLDDFNKIKEIYNFVRDDMLFGYNVCDEMAASRILSDGYGQCNTKSILFMALLRGVGIPCRIHGFTIDKKLQKGAMTGFVYNSAPRNVVHSWVEVFYKDKWYELEGFILDKEYLEKLKEKFKNCSGMFFGYGVATKNFRNPIIDWNLNNTYIQSEGINNDFGVYDSPDEFFREHRQKMSKLKEFLYRNIGRHLMNRNVKRIRKGL